MCEWNVTTKEWHAHEVDVMACDGLPLVDDNHCVG